MKKTMKKYQTKGEVKSKPKTGTYKPDTMQKIRYKLADALEFPAGIESGKELRKVDSTIDSNEMIRLQKKLGVIKKSGGATYKKGGSTKKKK